MRHTLTIPVRKPRVGLARALLARFNRGAGAHRHLALRRRANKEHKDLDQLVRECGEW